MLVLTVELEFVVRFILHGAVVARVNVKVLEVGSRMLDLAVSCQKLKFPELQVAKRASVDLWVKMRRHDVRVEHILEWISAIADVTRKSFLLVRNVNVHFV